MTKAKRIFFVSGPQRNMQPGYWLYDYLIRDGYSVIPYYNRVNDEEKITKRLRFKRLLSNAFSIIRHATKEDMVLVYDHDYSGYVISFLSVIFKCPFVVLKINQMGDNKSNLLPSHLKFMAKIGFKNMYTTCNNERICNLFAKELGIPAFHFIPIPDSISDFGDDIKKITDRSEEGYIFMGGATHRDYRLFVESARRLPQYKFLAVTFAKFKEYFVDAPSNVDVIYGLPEIEFYKKIAHCSLVFVPLTNDLQGGQMVLFQAALLGKPIITTENTAIHTYFDDDSITLINIGDVDSAVKSIGTFMNKRELRVKRGQKAQKSISKFTTEAIYNQYKQKLFPKAEYGKESS